MDPRKGLASGSCFLPLLDLLKGYFDPGSCDETLSTFVCIVDRQKRPVVFDDGSWIADVG